MNGNVTQRIPARENPVLVFFRFPVISRRQRAFCSSVLIALFFLMLIAAALIMSDQGLAVDFQLKRIAPCWDFPFGTDWLGRDMLTRTVMGLCRSLGVGLLAAFFSSAIAIVFGIMAATLGHRVDTLVSTLVNLVMATPHLVLLILISFAFGGGATGVIIAVTVSHWPNLTRIIRAEIIQLRTSDFVALSRRFGKTPYWIARNHMVPHILPQFVIGLILMFPHAILHEAGLTFLGFGLAPHTPSIGILLSESMRHLATGYWWLAVLPGVSLVFTVKLFDVLGGNLRILLDPRTTQE
jgi:peptide/nickel transport system permease protein